MSDETTTEFRWGVEPRDLDQFKEAGETLRKARQLADILPPEITTAEQAGEAAEVLKQLRFARDDADATAKEVKRHYDGFGAKVLAAVRELKSSNDAAEQSVKDRVLAYNQAQRKREEEERKKAERSERERQQRENERAEREERNSKAVAPSPRPAPAPKSVGTGFAKTTVRQVAKYEIVDESLLPPEYLKCQPDKAKIAAAAKAGLVVPGVRIWKEDQVATR